jgi:hypothetical protein
MTDQQTPPADSDPPPSPAPTRDPGRLRRLLLLLLLTLCVYGVVAYLVAPEMYSRYYRRHDPVTGSLPRLTRTGSDIPGDPVNIALLGSESEIVRAMTGSGWFVAQRLGLESDLRIAADTVLRRAYDKAPVSNLYLWGRPEDYAFEMPVGKDPVKRHHVRFWLAPFLAPDGRPVWAGAATYDARVGLSHTTLQVTHHIGQDVDTERNHVIDTLRQSGWLAHLRWVNGFHKQLTGRNGGGDPWQTDGRAAVGTVAAQATARGGAVSR